MSDRIRGFIETLEAQAHVASPQEPIRINMEEYGAGSLKRCMLEASLALADFTRSLDDPDNSDIYPYFEIKPYTAQYIADNLRAFVKLRDAINKE
jgi:hypothetical protein